jgi:pantoate--beta-alanine ligase
MTATIIPSHLQVVHDISSLRLARQTWFDQHLRVAFVPTMGNLHEGHFSLVREAKQRTDVVVVSIFVNPLQFGKGEDFNHYPRTTEQDVLALTLLGVDLVFAPNAEALYPERMSMADDVAHSMTIVPPTSITNILCGAKRPGHFMGVATIVAKLFNLVQPHVAVFGQKDYQQVAVIRQLIQDLNFSIQLVTVPTGRADDGLALSSRNQYLSTEERALAPRLYQMLLSLADHLKDGNNQYDALCLRATKSLKSMGFKTVEYVEILDPIRLTQSQPQDRQWVVLLAVKLGNTRLIDNIVVEADSLT